MATVTRMILCFWDSSWDISLRLNGLVCSEDGQRYPLQLDGSIVLTRIYPQNYDLSGG